jgi:hypothetical protein
MDATFCVTIITEGQMPIAYPGCTPDHMLDIVGGITTDDLVKLKVVRER